MKAVFKKTLVTVFASVTAISLFSVSASAATPKMYSFNNYTGSETVSVDLQGDYTKFARLEDKNGEIDSKNYTVSGDEQKTTVTLKEDYLSSLENGDYTFNGYFENILNTYEFTAYENVGVSIPAGDDCEFYNLTVGETEVDNANYDIEKTSGGFVITVKSEYLQTLPENTSFFAHYYSDSMCSITLQVEKQSANPSTGTEPTNNTSTTGKDTSLVSPKTGVNNYVTQIICVMLISAGVFTLCILSRKYKNKKN